MNAMQKIYLLTLSLPLLLCLGGCAQLTKMQIESTCSKNAAYAAGINDAKANKDMRSDYAQICPDHQDEYDNSYKAGYKFGLQQHSKTIDININHSSQTAQCMKDNFGDEYCGLKKGDNCVKNAYGDIKCGLHCSINDFNEITCAKERYSKKP